MRKQGRQAPVYTTGHRSAFKMVTGTVQWWSPGIWKIKQESGEWKHLAIVLYERFNCEPVPKGHWVRLSKQFCHPDADTSKITVEDIILIKKGGRTGEQADMDHSRFILQQTSFPLLPAAEPVKSAGIVLNAAPDPEFTKRMKSDLPKINKDGGPLMWGDLPSDNFFEF